ncbi:36953_t:CDS:2, partial [Racocetra persica]
QREHMIFENLLCLDTIDNNFIEDVVDEPQATLKAILDNNKHQTLLKCREFIGLVGFHLSINTTIQVDLNLQSLRKFQSSNYPTSIQKVTSQKNRFGVTFLTAKTTINVALETKSDYELVQLLKDFISAKRNVDNDN